LADLIADGLPT